MSESKDARIREQLGAWWAEEFPAAVMPTEALIRLSERLAALDMFDEPTPNPSAEEEARVQAMHIVGVCRFHADPSAHADGCERCGLISRIATALTKRDAIPLDKRAADRLADEVAVLVRRGVIDARSPAGDALLDYREPPSTPRADRMAAAEQRAEAAEARLEAMRAVVEAAREVADSPAEFDDERIGYVVLQVNRIDLSDLRQALGALDI